MPIDLLNIITAVVINITLVAKDNIAISSR